MSQVIPDNPPAAPFFEHLRFLKKPYESRAKVDVARCSTTLSGKGSRGWTGRRDGFVRDLNVAKFPGAAHEDSRPVWRITTHPTVQALEHTLPSFQLNELDSGGSLCCLALETGATSWLKLSTISTTCFERKGRIVHARTLRTSLDSARPHSASANAIFQQALNAPFKNTGGHFNTCAH